MWLADKIIICMLLIVVGPELNDILPELHISNSVNWRASSPDSGLKDVDSLVVQMQMMDSTITSLVQVTCVV